MVLAAQPLLVSKLDQELRRLAPAAVTTPGPGNEALLVGPHPGASATTIARTTTMAPVVAELVEALAVDLVDKHLGPGIAKTGNTMTVIARMETSPGATGTAATETTGTVTVNGIGTAIAATIATAATMVILLHLRLRLRLPQLHGANPPVHLAMAHTPGMVAMAVLPEWAPLGYLHHLDCLEPLLDSLVLQD